MSAGRKIMIYVRGRKFEIQKESISYGEVVNLGYPDGKHGPLYEYDVTWKDGPRGQEEGVLKEGQETKIVEGMRFDVKFTDKS